MSGLKSDSSERTKTYDWARRHGLYDPYSFAVFNEELWDDNEALAERARRWERDRLLDRKRDMEGRIDELRREVELIESSLERNEEKDFGS